MRNKYMNPSDNRSEFISTGGRFRGGKLSPVGFQIYRESEGAMLNASVNYELDPVAGRMITEVNADMIAVYVPAPAIDALKNPEDDYPGNAEVFRQKLMSGNPVFDLEPEGEISQRCGVQPRSINGTKMVNESVRLAHNCAVNFLRRRKYVKAAQLDKDNMAVTPAILKSTVLDRLNAVLDPEDRVNGAIDFSANLPIRSKGLDLGQGGRRVPAVQLSSSTPYPTKDANDYYKLGAGEIPGLPNVGIFAELSVGSITLKDFYEAENMHRLVLEMRAMVDKHPEYGEELVARFAAGLSVEVGNQPFIVYNESGVLGRNIRSGMDGPNLDTMQTDMTYRHEFMRPIPATEFGGVVIIFASIRPDEALASQPHPIASDVWSARNYVADEMAIDPVPVTVRDLYADCDQADENTVVCYNGNNHLMKSYVNYGFSRNTNPLDIENKTAIWQLEVPMSVTPESVIYPEELSHYPFEFQEGEVCTYRSEFGSNVRTPIVFGPAPVEELAAIETTNVFEDDPEA
ncbi:hypothetical protein [Roseobacter litoralis]|uniref:hypothetical protein n=1 Tax=Roseobacter litoralis TaxID=42443 RepID=UPI002494A0C6|nr:hypothetical protein [Roseobacter litoralis]